MSESETASVEAMAAKLTPLDRERLMGWQGPGGAAYNAISEDLYESGLLNAFWLPTPLGERVAAHLAAQVQA